MAQAERTAAAAAAEAKVRWGGGVRRENILGEKAFFRLAIWREEDLVRNLKCSILKRFCEVFERGCGFVCF